MFSLFCSCLRLVGLLEVLGLPVHPAVEAGTGAASPVPGAGALVIDLFGIRHRLGALGGRHPDPWQAGVGARVGLAPTPRLLQVNNLLLAVGFDPGGAGAADGAGLAGVAALESLLHDMVVGLLVGAGLEVGIPQRLLRARPFTRVPTETKSCPLTLILYLAGGRSY